MPHGLLIHAQEGGDALQFSRLVARHVHPEELLLAQPAHHLLAELHLAVLALGIEQICPQAAVLFFILTGSGVSRCPCLFRGSGQRVSG
ncbi:hypothetical protein GCM10025871_23170 [Deinococcus metallilatus]|nr:hypothetical protein GCM10025871_23170 [Deinococcus metallilatus]